MGEAPALCAREQAQGGREAEFTLHEPHIETNLVPFDDSALDLKVGQADARLPRLRRVEDQVVEGVPDLGLSRGSNR